MKKLIALLLVLFLLHGYALAAPQTIDLETMSQDELHTLIDRARLALLAYDTYTEGDKVILDQEGLKLTLKGIRLDRDRLYLDVVFENDGEKDMGINFDSSYVNGWSKSIGMVSPIAPGKKIKDTLSASKMSEVDVADLNDIEDIEFILKPFDGTTYRTEFETEPIRIDIVDGSIAMPAEAIDDLPETPITEATAEPEMVDEETAETQVEESMPELTVEPTLEPTAEPMPSPVAYAELKNGSKGNGVKDLQQRLIDLKYLTGKADGGYGNMTAQAVTDFQKAVGITPSGVADSETQTVLFADDAQENPNPPFDPSIYEKLNYKAVARDPDAYVSKLITFSGKVIQVMEGDDSLTHYRVASKGSYDDVVYVEYTRPEGASRVLEDDRVTVYGVCYGVYSYNSTMGGKITIPSCVATQINLR